MACSVTFITKVKVCDSKFHFTTIIFKGVARGKIVCTPKVSGGVQTRMRRNFHLLKGRFGDFTPKIVIFRKPLGEF